MVVVIKLALCEKGPVGGFVIFIFYLFGIIGVGVAAGITIAEAVLYFVPTGQLREQRQYWYFVPTGQYNIGSCL